MALGGLKVFTCIWEDRSKAAMKASQANAAIPAVLGGALGSSRSQEQGYLEQRQMERRINTGRSL
jgi:hypothetical protein